jgi:hypothetical protein
MSDCTCYLASHDWVQSPEPRVCKYVRTIYSRKNNYRLHVLDIDPPIPASLFRVASNIDVILVRCVRDADVLDIAPGTHIMVDVFLCHYMHDLVVDETQLQRLGMGMLHSNMDDALRHSPIDDDVDRSQRTNGGSQ